MKDTKPPFYISLVAIGLNIALAIVFSLVFKFGAYGLAWAQAIGAVLEIIILLFLMRKIIDGLFDVEFISGIIRMIIASALSGIVCYFLVAQMPLMGSDLRFFSTFPKFIFIGLVSSVVYILSAKILKLEESEPIIAQIKKIIFVQFKVK